MSRPSLGRLAATALALACLFTVFGEGGADARSAPARTSGDVVGASITHPEEWSVERERYTLGETYGFTLWRPGSERGETPAIRVALAYDLRPGQIEARVRDRLAAYPDLPMQREAVSVGERGHRGVAVGPIPGSTPSTEVYVAVNGRVYQINVYGQELGADGERLLSDLKFYAPSRPVGSLGLPDGRASESFYRRGDPELLERERAARRAEGAQVEARAPSASGIPDYDEKRIREGCWRAKSTFYFQTQHGMYANERWGPERTGWTQVGRPNYWGEFTHGDLEYGRCKAKVWTNDKFAVDYPLDQGDVIFSPFKRGKVTFAGRNLTHKDYGILVVIRAHNGKYVSLSAHLSGLAQGIKRGAEVTDETIIGYAGDTGGGDIPVGEPHLHQAYYRYPHYNPDGSPYGGAGLQVIYHHYVGTAAGTGPGVYKFGWEPSRTTVAKGDWISN